MAYWHFTSSAPAFWHELLELEVPLPLIILVMPLPVCEQPDISARKSSKIRGYGIVAREVGSEFDTAR